MEAFGRGIPPVGAMKQTNYPMLDRPVVRLSKSGEREILPMNWGLMLAGQRFSRFLIGS